VDVQTEQKTRAAFQANFLLHPQESKIETMRRINEQVRNNTLVHVRLGLVQRCLRLDCLVVDIKKIKSRFLLERCMQGLKACSCSFRKNCLFVVAFSNSVLFLLRCQLLRSSILLLTLKHITTTKRTNNNKQQQTTTTGGSHGQETGVYQHGS